MKLFNRLALPIFAASLALTACDKKEPAVQVEAAKAEAAKVEAEAAAKVDAAKAEADKVAAEAAAKVDEAKAEADKVAAEAAAKVDAAAAEAAKVEAANYVRANILHADGQNPVLVDFKGLEIVESKFDLAAVESSKVVFKLDLNKLESGNEKRDAHLKNPDFFETEKYPHAQVTVDRVKAVEGEADTYEGIATIDLHGVTKEVPVKFKVVEKKDTLAVIEGEVKDIERSLWNIGAEAAKSNVAPKFDVSLRLEVPHSK